MGIVNHARLAATPSKSSLLVTNEGIALSVNMNPALEPHNRMWFHVVDREKGESMYILA
jgi:hypothetical protein